MQIALLCPLYPPDTARSAAYTKELARRLAGTYDVAVVTYGILPERVPGARIAAIDKRSVLPVRLARFFFALWRAADKADIVYAENGASVELPLALCMLLKNPRVIFHIADAPAHAWVQKSFWRRNLERFVRSRSRATLEELPQERPEILPFRPYPSDAFAEYEASWEKHLSRLETLFAHA